MTYEDLRTQLGISRERLGGLLTSLAASRKRLPFEVDGPIERDAEGRRYRIEPLATELLFAAIDRAGKGQPPAAGRPE